MNRCRLVLSVILAGFAGYGCGGSSSSEADLRVDFGPAGNQRARLEIAAFSAVLNSSFTDPAGTRRRILLSGFNPFGGSGDGTSEPNVSGELMKFMVTRDEAAGAEVWVRDTETARLARSTSMLDGQMTDFYYFRGDTTYVTPALIQMAVAKILPHRVINFGEGRRNQVETGALNGANTSAPSYDALGRIVPELQNLSPKVDEGADAASETPFSWDAQSLARATGFPVVDGARSDNDYICNATARVVAATLAGRSVEYFPGVTLEPVDFPRVEGKMMHTFIHLMPYGDVGSLREATLRAVSASFHE